MDKCLLMNLSFRKDNFPKAKAETTGKYLDSVQVVSLFLWCMAEPAWVSLEARGLRLIHRMLPCAYLFIYLFILG